MSLAVDENEALYQVVDVASVLAMAFIIRRVVVVVYNGMTTRRPSMTNITFVEDVILTLDPQQRLRLSSLSSLQWNHYAVMPPCVVSSSGRQRNGTRTGIRVTSVNRVVPVLWIHGSSTSDSNDMRTHLQLVTCHLYNIFMCTCVSTYVDGLHQTLKCRNVAFEGVYMTVMRMLCLTIQ